MVSQKGKFYIFHKVKQLCIKGTWVSPHTCIVKQCNLNVATCFSFLPVLLWEHTNPLRAISFEMGTLLSQSPWGLQGGPTQNPGRKNILPELILFCFATFNPGESNVIFVDFCDDALRWNLGDNLWHENLNWIMAFFLQKTLLVIFK